MLVVYVVTWYISAILAVSSSKFFLKSDSSHFSLSFSQFIVSFLCTSVYLYIKYKITVFDWIKKIKDVNTTTLFNVALTYSIGFILTNYMLSIRTAPFVETIKSCEALTSLLLSVLLLHENVSKTAIYGIFIIVIGAILSSISSDDGIIVFDLYGVIVVLISNFMFSLRGYFRKKVNFPEKDQMVVSDQITNDIFLFCYVALIGSCITIPFCIYEKSITTENESDSGMNVIMIVNGVFYCLYNLTSFIVLSKTLFITHATLNVIRRAFIILSTAIIFKVPFSTAKLIGIVLTFSGLYLYLKEKSKSYLPK